MKSEAGRRASRKYAQKKRMDPEFRAAEAAAARKYRAAHPERTREIARRSYLKHGWRQQRMARMRGNYSESFSRMDIYERDGGRCYMCGRELPPDGFTLDHMIPVRWGGPHVPWNVNVMCQSCNARRGAPRIVFKGFVDDIRGRRWP